MTEINQYDFDDDGLDLWKQTRQPKLGTNQLASMGRNSAFRILEVLSDNQWHHTDELTKIRARLGPRILFLREEGYVIQDKSANDRGHLYRWNGQRMSMIRVTKEWQEAYYVSDHWRSKRSLRIRMDRNRCCWCSEDVRLEVHHWKYDLFQEAIADLMTLCRSCHQQIHAYQNMKIAFPKTVPESVFKRLIP